MSATKINRELQLFKLNVGLGGELTEMPTVCLLATDTVSASFDLSELVERLVPAGCRYIMTWGEAAEELHDSLDEVLEDRRGGFLTVVTASHEGEPPEDVAWFMANAAVPGESRLRCCVGYDDAVVGLDELLKAVRTATLV